MCECYSSHTDEADEVQTMTLDDLLDPVYREVNATDNKTKNDALIKLSELMRDYGLVE